jgi:PKD repeat protein
MRRILLALAATTIIPFASVAQSNPYGVAGAEWSPGGTMDRLGMPAGCYGYVWDNLYTTNTPNMVRTCKYWLSIGSVHRPQGYHEDTDTIDNPTWFSQWVQANPGKIWIIGNEPNGQDGLTPTQYARMFHTYYTFIRAIDPTTKFAVAGLAGAATTSSFNGNVSWWNQALSSYQQQFGENMPIDIWNCHGYRWVGNLDPDTTMAEYFTPYRHYVDTVSNGAYAGKELWLTEFGVPTWDVALEPSLVAEFARQIGPRLEAGGYSRFFWYIGPWPSWDLNQKDLPLLNQSNQPTVLGQAYVDLAWHYPNPIPPPCPSQLPLPAPPMVISNDFSSSAAPLVVQGGDWALDNGSYRQSRTTGGWGLVSRLAYDYRDVRADVDVKINAAADPTYWGGLSLRTGNIWTGNDIKTYLVFLRRDGQLGLLTAADGTVATVPAAVADTTIYHHLRAEIIGYHIEISVDGTKRITWTDTHQRRSSGAVCLYAGRADCSFDNLSVIKIVPPTTVIRIQSTQGYIPLTVNFDGRDSSTPYESIVSYAWDFDNDGTIDDTSGPLTSHLYALPGIYTVKLTVTDNCGFVGNTTTQVVVKAYTGDFDYDADVDQSDFGYLQACLSGPGLSQTDPACASARLDRDEDVDADDVALFLRCMRGSNVIADPSCPN